MVRAQPQTVISLPPKLSASAKIWDILVCFKLNTPVFDFIYKYGLIQILYTTFYFLATILKM
nr:MAG TPA: hypothetical protein [Caudoviricetes sp.]